MTISRLMSDYLRYKQTKGVLNCEGFPTFPQNLVRIGARTAEMHSSFSQILCNFASRAGQPLIATVLRCYTCMSSYH